MKAINYGRHHISEEDIKSVVDVLKSDYLTQGPKVREFEERFSEYIGCKYAVAVSNGTAALHLCSLAMGVTPGQRVITTPITFAATANSVLFAGGTVEFVDIDKNTLLLDHNKVKALLERTSPGTYSGIIPVDFTGMPVNLQELKEIADKHGLWITEDACHAPGGYFIDSENRKQNCGNGSHADLAIFSFHPVKHIACGEGGMITTNNEELYRMLLMLRSHGITKDPDLLGENHGSWYYEMQMLGYNYRLTDFQAALGISQLTRAESMLARRRQIAEIYNENFSGKPFIKSLPALLPGHAYHLYVIEVERRDELYRYLAKHSVNTQVHYIPVHLLPYYRKFGWKQGDMPNAERYYSRCLSLPMYPTLEQAEQDYIIKKIMDFYGS